MNAAWSNVTCLKRWSIPLPACPNCVWAVPEAWFQSCSPTFAGFTTFSENRDPSDVVDAINTYFGFASASIQEHGGIVDKYMGDAVMAHFNSPLLPTEEHAWLAVKAAWDTRER